MESIGKGRRATMERGRVPVVAGRAFSQLVPTRAGYRTAFFDNLLQTMRLQFPDQEVQATIVGAKEIASLVFVEAHLVLCRGLDLTSIASITTIHRGQRLQSALMDNVIGPRALAMRAIDRFLSGVSISP